MTSDEYLDRCKLRGETVWKCKQCGKRLIGRPASWHGVSNPGHELEAEPRTIVSVRIQNA